MHAPVNLNIKPAIILPNDSQPVQELKKKLNELILRFDELYRLLRADVEIMDFREMPPHYSVSHSRWKFVENPTTGDLELYHRSNNVWAPSGWSVIGDIT